MVGIQVFCYLDAKKIGNISESPAHLGRAKGPNCPKVFLLPK